MKRISMKEATNARATYRRRGIVKVLGAGRVRIGGRQGRDAYELGVGLRASKVLLLSVVHGGKIDRRDGRRGRVNSERREVCFSEPSRFHARCLLFLRRRVVSTCLGGWTAVSGRMEVGGSPRRPQRGAKFKLAASACVRGRGKRGLGQQTAWRKRRAARPWPVSGWAACGRELCGVQVSTSRATAKNPPCQATSR